MMALNGSLKIFWITKSLLRMIVLGWPVITVFWVLASSSVQACSCAYRPLLDLFANAEYAFVGTVTARFDPQAGAEVFSSGDPITYTFSVEMAWKGVSTDTLFVRSPRGGSSCGYGFKVGTQYIVMARDRKGHLQTGMCSGNAVFGHALAAHYLLPEPTPIASNAVWPTVSRGDLLETLRTSEDNSGMGAASLLAGEVVTTKFGGLSLAPLFLVDPTQAAMLLAKDGDSLETVTGLIAMGFRVLESESAIQRKAAIEGLGLLTHGDQLDDVLSLGIMDDAESVRSAARHALLQRYNDLTSVQADKQVVDFLLSIDKIPERERWVGVHQLRFFPNQKDRIIPFLEAMADTASGPRLKRTAREVHKEFSGR